MGLGVLAHPHFTLPAFPSDPAPGRPTPRRKASRPAPAHSQSHPISPARRNRRCNRSAAAVPSAPQPGSHVQGPQPRNGTTAAGWTPVKPDRRCPIRPAVVCCPDGARQRPPIPIYLSISRTSSRSFQSRRQPPASHFVRKIAAVYPQLTRSQPATKWRILGLIHQEFTGAVPSMPRT